MFPAEDHNAECPRCGERFDLTSATAGLRLRCGGCRSIVAVCRPGGGARSDLRLVAVEDNCPHCQASLVLPATLDGHQIRCKSCRAVLAVSASPWQVDLIEPGDARRREATPVGEPRPADVSEDAAFAVLDADDEVPARPRTTRPAEVPAAVTPAQQDTEPAAPEPAPDLSAPESATIEPRPLEVAWKGPRSSSRLSAVPFLSAAAVALVVGVAMAAWAWWPGGNAAAPHARYLPAQCQWYLSIRWSVAIAAGAGDLPEAAPGLAYRERLRTFLSSARIADADVERINIGRDDDGATVIVYWLRRAVRPAQLLEGKSFRDMQKSGRLEQSSVGGVAVLTLGDTALAFPEPKVIVNCPAAQVARHIRPAEALGEPLASLVDKLDAKAAVIVAQCGVPKTFVSQLGTTQPDDVSATTDAIHLGPTLNFTRTLHLESAGGAAALAKMLASIPTSAAQPPWNCPLLGKLKIASEQQTVRLRIELPASQLPGKNLEALARLFQ